MIQKKNALAIAGIETIRNRQGVVMKLSCTFVNNANTWAKDNDADYETAVIDCRTFKDEPSPMSALWAFISSVYGDKGIDRLFITAHSDPDGLYLFSKIRKELGEEDRYITLSRDWSKLKFNSGASIWIASCQAGGKYGKKYPACIAQTIANSSGATVHAFVSRSAQQRRPDGGFFQRPDIGGAVKFEPVVGMISKD